ncbi:MAG: hypothetical protein ABR908_15385 [Terriglobales bacterium]
MNTSQRRLFGMVGRKTRGTVVLNYAGTPQQEYTWYGEAFHEAGKSLVEQLRKDPHFGAPPDSFKAVPIMHLYRHAMELYLKGIVVMGGAILPLRGQTKIDDEIFSTHGLQRILQDVERIFEAFGWDWNFELEAFRSIADFRSVIGQLDAVKADALRYPTLKDGKTAALQSNFRFNIFEFCETLDPIYPVLEGAAYGAYESLRFEYEQTAEAWQRNVENAY